MQTSTSLPALDESASGTGSGNVPTIEGGGEIVAGETIDAILLEGDPNVPAGVYDDLSIDNPYRSYD